MPKYVISIFMNLCLAGRVISYQLISFLINGDKEGNKCIWQITCHIRLCSYSLSTVTVPPQLLAACKGNTVEGDTTGSLGEQREGKEGKWHLFL
jgi:hypothetical protein